MKGRIESRRRATVLLLVLVLIPVLAYGGYAFTHGMRAESKASITAGRQRQAYWLAKAGIEMVRALLADPENLDPSRFNLYDNPGRFAAQLVIDDETGARGFFSIVAPPEDPTLAGLRFGLSTESAKIPLGSSELLNGREALAGLPNITDEIADAILDWIDADDSPRELGAESSYYSQQSPPVRPRNGKPLSIGELLLVRGVTPALLYGEDHNLSGVLDAMKNDGEQSWPFDNSDGVLDRGWYHLLTLESKSANLNPDGEAKINLNGDIAEIATPLNEKFGPEFVAFLTAYKQQNQQIKTLSELIDAKVTVNGGASGQGGGGAAIAVNSSIGGSAGSLNVAAGVTLSGQQGGRSVQSGQSGQGNQQPVVIESPWKSQNAAQFLPSAMEELTLSEKTTLSNLIDVNHAPAAVLQVLPGISAELASRIASSAQSGASLESSPAWLLTDGLVTLEQFRAIEPYVTASGRVFRVESVGYFEDGTTVARVEAVIDASGSVPKVVRIRQLPPGGPSYSPQLLSGGAVGGSP